MDTQEITLDDRTIAKLALAIAEAIKLSNKGEVIGPIARKVTDYMDALDHDVPHFAEWRRKL